MLTVFTKLLFITATAVVLPAADSTWTGQNAKAVGYQQFFDDRRVFEVLDIAADETGNLWIVTRGPLLRFDGTTYLTIDQSLGFPLASARRICRSGDGALWFGGRDGLARFWKGAFEMISREAMVGLACTGGASAYTASPQVRRWTPVSGQRWKPVSVPVQANRELVAGEDGRVWFGCKTNICILDESRGDVVETLVPAKGHSPLVWTGAAGNKAGRIFASEGRVVHELFREGSSFTHRPLDKLFVNPFPERQFMAMPGRGEIWASGKDGIADLTGRVERWTVSIGGSYATTVFPIGPDALWMGTLASGLFRLDLRQKVEHWTQFEGEIRTVLSTERTQLIASSSGVWRLPGNRENPILVLRGDVFGMIANPDDTFWAVSRTFGPIRFDLTGRVLAMMEIPPTARTHLREMFRDSDGRILVAGKTGLFRLEESNPPRLVSQPPLDSTYLSEIQTDRGKGEWITAEGGIWHHGDQGYQRLDDFGVSPPSPLYRTLGIRSPEDLWIGYRVGIGFSHLYRKDGRWQLDHFDDASVPGTRDVHFLRVDRRGWLWRGTREGVFVTPEHFPRLRDWALLSARNGLRGGAVSMQGFQEDPDGSIWIATYETVTKFRPEPSWFDETRWSCWVSSLRVNNVVTYLDHRSFPKQYPAGEHRIVIEVGTQLPFPSPPARLNIAFGPSSPNGRHPDQFRQEVLIDSADEHIIEARLLFAGKTSAVTTYSFTVATPWYANRTFYAVIAMLMAASTLLWRFRPAWLVLAYARVHYRFRLARSARTVAESSRAVSSADLSGAILQGRYEVDRLLATGGFSSVYFGRDIRNESRGVAIKAIRIQPDLKDWQYRHFSQEVAALNSIRHDSVVTILESWIDDHGQPILVMPFIEGESMRSWLNGRQASSSENRDPARSLLASLAEGIAALHRRGVVHCDLKPENIYPSETTGGLHPVIIDFGVSGLRRKPEELVRYTRAIGTPPYMAPEQTMGHFSVATDAYAFAVITIELLFGTLFARTPFTWDWVSRSSLETWFAANQFAPAPRLADHFVQVLDVNAERRRTDVTVWLTELFALQDQPR